MKVRTEFVLRPYRPAWWLRGGHAQTVLGKALRGEPAVALERERLELPDGDFLDIDYGEEPGPDAPIGLVLHGLEGSSRRGYTRVAYLELLKNGVQPVGMNFRSCSGEPNRTARFYHSGDTDDLRLVLEHLGERFPGRPIGAIGFSLGGNVLLKYLGEEGEAARSALQAAVAISVPYDLVAGSERLGRGIMGRAYSEYFLRMLRRKAAAKADMIRDLCDLDTALRARSLPEFDTAFTAPLHGFADAEDYYRQASCGPYLVTIRVPTLLIHAIDDPFLPVDAIPWSAVETNPHLIPGFTKFGGHVGFITGSSPRSARFWSEEEAGRFLGERLLPARSA